MPFPKSLLADHEELILDLRLHWVALVVPGLIGVACVVGIGLSVVWTDPNGIELALRWIGVTVGLVILLLFCVRQVVNWLTDNFVVTTDRVVRRRGLIAKNSMEIPLEAITDVRFQQGIVGRIIGAGSLIISSASERGREEFADIRHPERVQKTIYEMGEQNQRRMFAGGTKHDVGGGGVDSVAEEIRKLSRLRDDGVLTEGEFQSQKDKLLGNEEASQAPAQAPPVVSPPPADDTPPFPPPPPVAPPPTT